MELKKVCAALAAGAVVLSGTAGTLPEAGTFAPASVLTAKAEEPSGLTYTVLRDGTMEITGCDKDLASVEIPEQIMGRVVTSIGEFAFRGCESLADITIPDSVTSIGFCAFHGCTSLTDITIPDSVTSIGSEAFYGCTSLMNITIPDSVTSIGFCAFYVCTSLTDITIPDSVTSIGYGAFKDTAWYDSQPDGLVYAGKCLYKYKGEMPDNCTVTLRAGTVGIAEEAFSGCTSLMDITIPDSVTSIGFRAFSDCTSLTDITIPDGVTSIGTEAFFRCTSLTDITIPDGVTSIGDGVFNGCTSLMDITIPDSVMSIGECAFEDCMSLTDITIPDSVTSVGSFAFYGTTWYDAQPDGLVYIGNWLYEYKGEMPDNCTVTLRAGTVGIGARAFCNCTNLTDITIPDSVTSIGNDAFSGCTSLTSITIPDGVTSIGDEAFYGCTRLTDITIPNSVTSIGEYAFFDCTSLTNITILNPGCKIYDDAKTIINNYTDPENFPIYTGTITGYENSIAQAYAEKYGYTFVSLGEAPAKLQYGDADESGEVDIGDVIALCKASMGTFTLTDQGLLNGDVNGDGKTDTTDASCILQSLIGLFELPN